MKFSEFTEEKRKEYELIIMAMLELNQNLNSQVLLYNYNDQEKVLEINDNLCRSWYFNDDKSISYFEFLIDDNFELVRLGLDDAILEENGDEAFFQNRKTNCLEDFLFMPVDGKDRQGYDGMAIYSQYNEFTDTRLTLLYQHMVKPNNYVYKMHLVNPLEVIIDRKASSKRPRREKYARYDFDATKNYNAFRTATIKDYGLLKTLNKDLISLQKTNKFSRYYKEILTNSENEVITTYPFGDQYTIEDVNKYINKLGFNDNVPDYLVKMNNQENEDYMEALLISANLKNLNEAYIKEKGHSFKLVK